MRIMLHGHQRKATRASQEYYDLSAPHEEFSDGDDVYIEPWRAKAFPVIQDLMVNRSAFDRIITAGGYISSTTGGVGDANSIPVFKDSADRAMDAAQCIGCGACVAACKNASAMLFVSAKIAHLGSTPQGQVEADKRTLAMVEAMDAEGFGNCTNTYACQASCPKGIKADFIKDMNKDFLKARIKSKSE